MKAKGSNRKVMSETDDDETRTRATDIHILCLSHVQRCSVMILVGQHGEEPSGSCLPHILPGEGASWGMGVETRAYNVCGQARCVLLQRNYHDASMRITSLQQCVTIMAEGRGVPRLRHAIVKIQSSAQACGFRLISFICMYVYVCEACVHVCV